MSTERTHLTDNPKVKRLVIAVQKALAGDADWDEINHATMDIEHSDDDDSAISTETTERRRGLLLLRLPRGSEEPLYFVVEHDEMWAEDEEHIWEFFVNENTCPTNLVPIQGIIDGDDTDPHGIFEFVQWVPRPASLDVYPRTEDRDFWRSIFDRLPEAAEVDNQQQAGSRFFTTHAQMPFPFKKG